MALEAKKFRYHKIPTTEMFRMKKWKQMGKFNQQFPPNPNTTWLQSPWPRFTLACTSSLAHTNLWARVQIFPHPEDVFRGQNSNTYSNNHIGSATSQLGVLLGLGYNNLHLQSVYSIDKLVIYMHIQSDTYCTLCSMLIQQYAQITHLRTQS